MSISTDLGVGSGGIFVAESVKRGWAPLRDLPPALPSRVLITARTINLCASRGSVFFLLCSISLLLFFFFVTFLVPRNTPGIALVCPFPRIQFVFSFLVAWFSLSFPFSFHSATTQKYIVLLRDSIVFHHVIFYIFTCVHFLLLFEKAKSECQIHTSVLPTLWVRTLPWL